MNTAGFPYDRLKRILQWAGFLFFFGALAASAFQTLQQDESHFDDAYMVLRYADHLIKGYGLSWNIGEGPVYGATSLGYLLWVSAGLMVWPFRPDQFLVFSSWVFAALSAGILFKKSRFTVLSAVLLGYLLLEPVFAFNILTGIDTTFAVFTNTLLIVFVLRFLKKPSLSACIFSAALGYVNFLARPDNIIYSGLFPILGIAALLPRQKIRFSVLYSAIFLALLTADTFLKIRIFGSAVPLSAYVKAHGFYQGYWAEYIINPLQYFNDFLKPAAPFLLLSIFLFQKRHLRMLTVFYVPFLLTCMCLFQAVQIMGFPGRFFMPSLPYLIMPTLLQIEDVSFSWPRDIKPWLLRFVTAAAVFFLGTFSLNLAEQTYEKKGLEKTQGHYDEEVYDFMNHDRLVRIKGWKAYTAMAEIGGHIPKGASVAATEYGYLSGHYPDVPIVDMAGLHNPHLAIHGFSAEDILSKKPDLIWMPHWAYTNMVRQFWESEEFWQDYEYYPQIFDFGIAIRRTGPHYSDVKAVVWEEWQKLYPGVSMESLGVSNAGDLQKMIQKAHLDKLAAKRKPM